MEQLRGYSKGYYFSAVASMILGAALLVWPETSMQTFCYTLGAVSVIFGLVKIIMYFTRDRMESLMEPDLVVGISVLAFGAFVLLKSQFVLSVLPFFTGVFLLIGGVVQLQGALDLKRLGFGAWWLILLIALAMFVLGGVLVANPFEAARVVVILIGTGLLADGLANLFNLLMITHLFKKAKQKKAEQEAVIVEAHEVVSREDRKEFPAKK